TSGSYRARRLMPEPFSLGEHEEVKVIVTNAAAAGLKARLAEHAPAGLNPRAREVGGSFDPKGTIALSYATSSPRRGAFRFGQLDLQVFRKDGWLRRQVRLQLPHEVAVFPNIVAIKRIQLTLRRGLRALVGQGRAQPPGPARAFAGPRDYLRGRAVMLSRLPPA